MPGIGPLVVDVAYGGMFYVLVEAARVGLAIEPENAAVLARVGELVKRAAREQLEVVHPTNRAINYVESLLWWGPPKDQANHGRNTVVISMDSGSDTGRTRLARVGQEYRHEGILDSVFRGRIRDLLALEGTPAVTPEITGRAWISGYTDHVIQDDDPFQEGLVLADF